MGVKERLREYIKTLNISEREFCRQIGVSSSYVNNIRQSIQPDKMKAIGEKFPELNPMWLLTGDGTMRNGDNTNRISGNNNTAVAGNGNQVTTNDIAGLIELQKGYQEMISLLQAFIKPTFVILPYLKICPFFGGSCAGRTIKDITQATYTKHLSRSSKGPTETQRKLYTWNGKNCLTCIPSNSRRPGLRWKPCAMCFVSAALPVFAIPTWQNCAEAT